MCKALWISGFVIVAGLALTLGITTSSHPSAKEEDSRPKLYEIQVAQNTDASSYQHTEHYLSKDGQTSTTITHGNDHGTEYRIIETKTTDPVQLRQDLVREMDDQINTTLAASNQFNNKLEPGIVMPKH